MKQVPPHSPLQGVWPIMGRSLPAQGFILFPEGQKQSGDQVPLQFPLQLSQAPIPIQGN